MTFNPRPEILCLEDRPSALSLRSRNGRDLNSCLVATRKPSRLLRRRQLRLVSIFEDTMKLDIFNHVAPEPFLQMVEVKALVGRAAEAFAPPLGYRGTAAVARAVAGRRC